MQAFSFRLVPSPRYRRLDSVRTNGDTVGVRTRYLAATVVTTVLLASAPGLAVAQNPPEEIRLAGPTRYETAAAIARQSLSEAPAGSQVFFDVVQDSGWQAPLMMASWSSAASANGVPALLPIPEDGRIPGEIATLITEEGQTASFSIVGAPAFIETVNAQIGQLTGGNGGFGFSLDPDDRVGSIEALSAGVAADVAEAMLTGPNQATLASAEVFADALTAGPLAPQAGLLVLTRTDRLNPTLVDNLGRFDRITIVGGAAALPESFADQIRDQGVEVVRVAGSNRYLTALQVAQTLRGEKPGLFDGTDVGLARADVPADAIAASPLASLTGAPILLTDTGALPVDYSTEALADVVGCPGRTFVYGGQLAIADQPVEQFADVRCG